MWVVVGGWGRGGSNCNCARAGAGMDAGVGGSRSKSRRARFARRDHKPGGPSKASGLARLAEESRNKRVKRRNQQQQQWRLEMFGACPEPTPQELAGWLCGIDALVTDAVAASSDKSTEAISKLQKLIFYGKLDPKNEELFLDALECGALMSKMYAFLLEDGRRRDMCLELLCVLSYIPTQRDHAAQMFNYGVVQSLLWIVAHAEEISAIKAMQILGSISILHKSCHQLVFESDACIIVCRRVVLSKSSTQVKKYGSFALMMITYGEEIAPIIHMGTFVPAAEVLMSGPYSLDETQATLLHTATAICNVLGSGPKAGSQRDVIYRSDLLRMILEGLGHIQDEETLMYLMKCLKHISVEKPLLDGLLDKGLAATLNLQMRSPYVGSEQKREMCDLVDNLVMDSPERLRVVIQHGLLEIMCSYIMQEDFQVKKVAALVLSNCAALSSDEIIRECFATRLMVKSFVSMLDALDDSAAYYGMSGLSTILASGEIVKADEDENPYTFLIEEHGGREALHRLTERGNSDLAETAIEVLDDFYSLMENSGSVSP